MIISIFIFLLIYINFLNPIKLDQNSDGNNQKNNNNFISKIIQKDRNKFNIKEDNNNFVDNNEGQDMENYYWYIKIPSISLKAPIRAGTDLETLKKYVGHFEGTSLENGNIGLAAHNRRI